MNDDGPINILIVDDEPKNLTVLETVLTDPSYRLVRAESADQALLALVAEEFALLILDIRMPGMTGFELAKMIKERKKTALVPIIFLTAFYNEDQHVLDGYSTGAVDYLHKPLNPAILRSKVAVFAELHRKNRESAMANRVLLAEVTERRRAEDQLRELNETLDQRVMQRTEALRASAAGERARRAELEAVMDAIPVAVFIARDAACQQMTGNRATMELLGLPHGRNPSNPSNPLSIAPENERPDFEVWFDGRLMAAEEQPMQRAAATGQAVLGAELEFVLPDGGNLHIVGSALPLFDDAGAVRGCVGAFVDITKHKRAEEALKEADLRKSEFLANMSHELRTPLNAIIGFSEVLKDGLMGELTDQQRRFIGDIFSSGNHLLALINDILDLSKVEAGTMMLDLESVQVSSLFVNSLSIVREKAAAHHIRLSIDAAEDLGSFQADTRKVKQIAYNLLSNAVKFTIEGGEVSLRVGRVPRAEVGQLLGSWAGRTLPLADNEFAEFLKISVTDTGIGISPEGLEQLFKPFSQIDSGLARKYEGTGLGLAMVKLLAELHGGTVAVESAVGEGSCFTVWLPFRAPEEGVITSVKAPAAPLIEARSGARTALVVEDDFKSADLIRVQLEATGFKVLHAASAEAALVLAAQQPLSLITLDIMLPNMDGWEFLSRLKQMPTLTRIPVVIISIVADRNQGFALGAAAVMQKPMSRQELYASLVELGLIPRAQGEALKVLVVDDDPKAVDLIAVHLFGLGITVLRAHGGREAINTAREELPDLIVLDLMMPEVSGFDVVEALQKQLHTARIPILVVTSKQITAEDRATLTGRVATIMEKGEFDGARFMAEVRRAMSGRPLVA